MTYEDNYLAHYGIRGQRWGLRRYQNEDGTLTAEGRERYQDLVKLAGNQAAFHVRVANANQQTLKQDHEAVKKYGREHFERSIKEHQKEAKRNESLKKKYEKVLKTNVANMSIKDLKGLNKEHSVTKHSKLFAENFGDWFFGRAKPKGNARNW